MKAISKRAYCDPSKGLLQFLCEKYVDEYGKVSIAKGLSTAQKYKPAYAFWSKKTNVENVRNAYIPFEYLRKISYQRMASF